MLSNKKKEKILLVGEPMELFMANSEGKLEDIESYNCAVAGAEYNVAIGLTRLGHSVGYLTKLGNDPFARFIIKSMNKNSISTDLITFSDERKTGFMLKGMKAGDPETFYFRKNSAASDISCEDIEKLDLTDYTWLHMTGIFPALSEKTKVAAIRLIEKARENNMTVSFDPNLRPALWKDQKTMVETLNVLAKDCDYIFPGIAEAKILTGKDNEKEASEFYHNIGVKNVFMKIGKKGVYVSTKEDSFVVRGCPVKKVVDTVGAGDGFAAGVISAVNEGLSLKEAARRGNAIGGIQITFRGDNEGLPTHEQLEKFLIESDKMFINGEGV